VSRAPSPTSVGVIGNAAEILPELIRRGVKPTRSPNQTSAHDPINGYLPRADLGEWEARRFERSRRRARGERIDGAARAESIDFWRRGVPTFDYGNNIADGQGGRRRRAFEFPGFVPAYIRPLYLPRIGPFRWAALVGRSRRHLRPTSQR